MSARLAIRLVVASDERVVGKVLTRVIDLEGARPPVVTMLPFGDSSRGRTLALDPGEYLVEARFPSGVLVREKVVVTDEGLDVELRVPTNDSKRASTLSIPQHATFVSDALLGNEDAPVVNVVIASEREWWERVTVVARGESGIDELWQGGFRTFQHPIEPQQIDNHASRYRLTPTPMLPFVVVERGSIAELISLPGPLPDGWRQHTGEIELVVPRDPSRSVGVVVADPLLGTILGYLAAGSIHDASVALEDPSTYRRLVQTLFRKRFDPFAAAAAACVLVHAASRAPAEWDSWLNNLANWFPMLPDGATLVGLRLARRGEREEAEAWFDRAIRAGIPLYAPTARSLFAGLQAFGHPAAEFFRPLFGCLQLDQAFSVFRFDQR